MRPINQQKNKKFGEIGWAGLVSLLWSIALKDEIDEVFGSQTALRTRLAKTSEFFAFESFIKFMSFLFSLKLFQEARYSLGLLFQ